MTQRCTLIGCRGSGKTTVGRLLAQRLRWLFIDADERLETQAGKTIPELFASEGVAAFRAREAHCLAEILRSAEPFVLATGGGVVLHEGNRKELHDRGGVVVYLDVDAASLQERLRANSGGRPSLTGKNVADEIPQLLAERDGLYRQTANLIVDGRQAVEAIVERIAVVLNGLARPTPGDNAEAQRRRGAEEKEE